MKIKFINHACFQFLLKDYSILIDPWFFGKVFNNSWSLFRETSIETIDIKSLKWIFISHEHPDHLHFETLKEIKNINDKVTVIFPYRKDATVKKVIEKIGLKFKFIKQNSEKFFIDENNYVKFFSFENEGDHTMVFKINERIIVNQNDDYTLDKTVKMINSEFPSIDILLTQFSLAGYYGNFDEEKTLKIKGHDFHLNRVIEYSKKFNPSFTIPFASYVYFCRDYNKYLNKFIVTPKEVISALGNDKCQLVWYGDEVIFDNFKERNLLNQSKLNDLFNINKIKDFSQSITINDNELVKIIKLRLNKISFIEKIKTFIDFSNPISSTKGLIKFFLLINRKITVHLYDINKVVYIDFLRNSAKISVYKKNIKIDFSLPSEDLFFMFKFPWGSDTVNISATVNFFSKKSMLLFNFLLSNYKKFGAKII